MKHVTRKFLSLVVGGCNRCQCQDKKKSPTPLEHQTDKLLEQEDSQAKAMDVLPALSVS